MILLDIQLCDLSLKNMIFCGAKGQKLAATPKFSRCLEQLVLFSAKNSHVFTEKLRIFLVMSFEIDV